MTSSPQQQAISKRRVLSIQSHVVHGYVGNKSATFPLQVLGYEVDAINSVQFSNHTGYKVIKGQVLQEQELADLIEGLEGNDLLDSYSHLLTGYIGNASFLRQVADIVKRLRAKNPQLIYVCDPVLGDNGKMYVPESLLPIYRDEIVPLADIVTPNQFEVELLTGVKIKSESDVWQAVDWFHQRNIDTVAISSSDIVTTAANNDNNDTLRTYLSKRDGSRYALNIPKQGGDISFTGTGDLFAALFLAHSHAAANETFHNALEKTIASLQAVIKRTIESMPADVRAKQRAVTSRERELKLIQSKQEIETPQILLKAERIA